MKSPTRKEPSAMRASVMKALNDEEINIPKEASGMKSMQDKRHLWRNDDKGAGDEDVIDEDGIDEDGGGEIIGDRCFWK